MELPPPLGIGVRFHRVVVLTGAGVSVASGLPTYRGPGGLWERDDIARIVHAESIPTRLPELWRLYADRRRAALSVGPNPAHVALADAQRRWPGALRVVTQNVDGLHQRAGSTDVIELHGSGLRSRCTRCALPPFEDISIPEGVPTCPACGAPLRPDVVLFGETLSEASITAVGKALTGCDLFLVVGTSSVVVPAAYLLLDAYDIGARCVSVNVVAARPENPYLHDEFVGPAEVLLPALLA